MRSLEAMERVNYNCLLIEHFSSLSGLYCMEPLWTRDGAMAQVTVLTPDNAAAAHCSPSGGAPHGDTEPDPLLHHADLIGPHQHPAETLVLHEPSRSLKLHN